MMWPNHQHLQLYVRNVIAEQELGRDGWSFARQFKRQGEHLSFAERESLLARNYQVFFGGGSEILCPSRALYVRDYIRVHLESSMIKPRVDFYPWVDLVDEMKAEKKRILLFGFGSLINPESAAYNLSKRKGPALAFGLKRVFNYYDDQIDQCILGMPTRGYQHERAKLNAVASEDPFHPINGVLYEVDVEELIRLRPRERGYDLVKLHVVDYIDALDVHCMEPKITEAWALRATQKAQVSTDYVPDINYLNVCAEGVRPYGSEFARLFLNTTYLADGKTPLQGWLFDRIYDLARSSTTVDRHKNNIKQSTGHFTS